MSSPTSITRTTAYEPVSFQIAGAEGADVRHQRGGAAENQQRAEPVRSPMRVLIADDDAAVLCIMERILSGAGYGVRTAGNGEAAWEAFCAENFDVVITDHDMPRLTGLDLLRRLRHRAHQVPVVLISGNMHLEETDLPRLLSPGTSLQKPFSGFELLATVRRVTTTAASENADAYRAEQIPMEFDRH